MGGGGWARSIKWMMESHTVGPSNLTYKTFLVRITFKIKNLKTLSSLSWLNKLFEHQSHDQPIAHDSILKQ